ncbi:ABC transporter ATP-binding protein [Desulfosarcina sp. OttesenSCG-928-A07]|nr:ABC transporter ATP-binding protein [Desulfosarcina sp. OttesenSCG-928-A07]
MDMNPDIAVSLRGITNRFGSQSVHENLDLDIRKGEILGLIGGSGTGKSVLLRTIIGLQRQSAGSVRVMGINLDKSEANWEAARKIWGVLFQDGALFSSLTVLENIQAPMRFYTNTPQQLMDELAALKLRLVGLPPEAGAKYPNELSGGMRKRAGLARALSMDPTLLFLDEPTAGLDPISAAGFDQLLKTLSRAMGLTVLMVTHDIDSLYAVCDRVAVLGNKKILAVDTIENLRRINNDWLKEYFGGPRGRAAAAGLEKSGPGPEQH